MIVIKLKGSLKRAKKEYDYVARKDWSFEECGKFWDTVHDYDEIDDETYAYKRRFYDTIKISGIKKNSAVLDIDCRTGNGTVFFRKYIKKAVCISPSQNFLKICRQRVKKYGVSAETKLLRKLPLEEKSKSFDQVLFFETLEHIAPGQRIAFVKELQRVLKPKGELILTCPNILWEPVHWFAAIFEIHHSEGPHRFVPYKKIKNLLRQAGFHIKKETTTVFIPAGPRWLTRFGEILEATFGEYVMRIVGLRHIFICEKKDTE